MKSSRRQLQLQQFSEQQQQLAAERAAKWGQGLLRRLQRGLLGISGGMPPARASTPTQPFPAADSELNQDGSEVTTGPQQQQQGGGLNLLRLHGLWPPGASAASGAAAASGRGLLPAPPADAASLVVAAAVDPLEEPKRPSGADWGVTDAALSLRSLLGSSLGAGSSSGSTVISAVSQPNSNLAAVATVAPLAVAKGTKGQLSAQQQQLRNILSTVVPFDAVSLTGSNPGLTWSAQQGLGVLKEAASRLYNELAVGSFSGGLKVEIQGRLKSLRSVHTKMERKECSMEVSEDGSAEYAHTEECIQQQR